MIHPMYELLKKLEDAHIYFTLGRSRPDTIRVNLTIVGERKEIDVFDDGHMEVSRFFGDESIVGEKELVDKIIEENRD